ncbi:hypothetical protein Tco_0519002 [Tanacetum coccineum]
MTKTLTVAPPSSSSVRRRTNVVGSRITLTAPLNITDVESDLPFWQRTWFIGLLLVMALSFFGLALFLFLSLDYYEEIEYTSAAPVYNAPVNEGLELKPNNTLQQVNNNTQWGMLEVESRQIIPLTLGKLRVGKLLLGRPPAL